MAAYIGIGAFVVFVAFGLYLVFVPGDRVGRVGGRRPGHLGGLAVTVIRHPPRDVHDPLMALQVSSWPWTEQATFTSADAKDFAERLEHAAALVEAGR